MAKDCPEEFNPWPPFVDIFASVILVMLLFLIILIVNVAYYSQFNTKNQSTDVVKKEQSSQEVIVVTKNNSSSSTKKESIITFHKIKDPTFDEKKSTGSLFGGSNSIGNAVKRDQNRSLDYSKQKIITSKNQELIIKFQDKEIFMKSNVQNKLRKFIEKLLRKNPSSKIVVTAGYPTKIISSTIAKQISLGRVINTKNVIYKTGVKRKNIKFNLKRTNELNYDYGYIKVGLN